MADLNDIPAQAVAFADAVDAGQHGEVRAAVVAIETPEGVVTFAWGQLDDRLAVAGLFAAGLHDVVGRMMK